MCSERRDNLYGNNYELYNYNFFIYHENCRIGQKP